MNVSMNESQNIEFTAKNSMEPKNDVSDSDYSNKGQKSSLKSSLKSSVKIIECISKNQNITIAEIAVILNMSERAIKKHIAVLKRNIN